MYQVIKSWDNRKEAKALCLPTINGRTWTQRIQWLEDESGTVKLKFDDNRAHFETGVSKAFAQTVWDRFVKLRQSINAAISILGIAVTPPRRASKKDE